MSGLRWRNGLLVPDAPLTESDRAFVRLEVERLERNIANRGWFERFCDLVLQPDDYEKTQLAVFRACLEGPFD